MADALEVRDVRPDERAAVRALTLAAYGEYEAVMEPSAWAGLRGALEAALDRASAAERIVALHRGALVGSVMLFPPAAEDYGGAADAAPWPELRLLAVSPDARGLGVGQALVDECVRRARAAGAADLGLHTSRSMRAALRMYERMGFVRAPEYDFHPEGAEVVWAYRLGLGDGDGSPGAE
ncbi:GNAT family N-acetyltransferase [Longimicrobium sp.]|uniref:GNAT family N-acetyltransferase n=1 Tax=Longimicrobium sp. TaxID=2029185 RepID=UPI002B77A9D1|nr:GNAT family N-acetyltransferase [Longimicrobium sp.]HSU17734.1 GNAT family N-acetyltransferase [Longimicrobium sp.]